nr:CIA30 family protein [Loktanella sp. SALINAS62]
MDFGQSGKWRFISDQVMGGRSEGHVDFHAADGRTYAALRGTVSTANNGGFIQIRRDVAGLPADATRLILTVRGNGESYRVHLRTIRSERPWNYFAAGFVAPPDLTEVVLPLADFAPNSDGLTAPVTPADVRSIGIVAYGADYTAKLDIAAISVV